MRIRRASLAEILAIDSAIFKVSGPPSSAELKGSVWWVAADRDGVVGYAGVWVKPAKKAAYLTRAGVLPCARGLGLQRRLITVRERYARTQGCVRAYTYTHLENFPSMANLIKCSYFPYWADEDYLWFQKALVSGLKLKAFDVKAVLD